MKKHLTQKLTAITLAILLLCTLASCSQTSKLMRLPEDERAVAVWELINENADAADSFSATNKTTISGTMYGVEGMEATSDVRMTVHGYTGKNMIYRIESTTVVETGNSKTTVQFKEGYESGKMYTEYSDDLSTQQLFSAISQADFLAHVEERSNDNMPDITADSCTVKTCVKEEDGTFTLTFSGFTEDSLDQFEDMLGTMRNALLGDHKITDVHLTVKVSEDFYPKTLDIEYVMEARSESAPEAPVITMEMAYDGFNTTEAPAAIDFLGYTEVDDLRVLTLVSDLLSERQTAESGAFQTTLSQEYKISGQTQTFEETDEVTFTNRDGAYTYQINADDGNYDYDISYANGKQRVIVKLGNSTLADETTTSDDNTAMLFINGLMDPGSFTTTNIADIEVKDAEAGIYVLTVKEPDLTAFASVIQSVRGTSAHGDATVTVTIQNGRLTEYVYELKATSSTASYGTLAIQYTASCVYIDEATS